MANEGKPTRRSDLLRRKEALWLERSSWDTDWADIARFQFPRAGRFLVDDTNKGGRKDRQVYDNSALFAHRTLAAGMMSGMTSPARPWFQLGLQDHDLVEYGPVKSWLFQVAEKMRAVFSASNTYNALHQCYEELGAFGTWANFVRPNFDTVIHHYPMTIGEYALATNDLGYVDTLLRQVKLTVGQLVRQFGRENCSTAVQTMYDRGTLDAWVPVFHYIAPREHVDRSKADNLNFAFKSVYFEQTSDNDKPLGESGFKRFPALCPRWVVTGNDVYGRSPGMDCQGDVKQLQLAQLRKAQAIDYQVNPPLQVPPQYKDQASKRLPGGVMFVDATSPGGGVRSAFDVNLRLDYLLADIQDTRERVKSAYYADLFLMMANDTRSGTTATEIAERHEEKLLMLGPVIERLENELLRPMIDIVFDRLVEADALPPPPDELRGTELNVEFISALAQAQRAVAAGGSDRLINATLQIAQARPEVLDKLDFDQAIDDYARMYGVNPSLVVPDDKVAELRAQRAQAMQVAQAAANAPQAVESAKTASEINPQGLADVMGMFAGYNTPTPGTPR